MLCYKDRSWCIHSLNTGCMNEACSRFYTEEEKQYNKDDMPLSIADFHSENCGFIPRWNSK